TRLSTVISTRRTSRGRNHSSVWSLSVCSFFVLLLRQRETFLKKVRHADPQGDRVTLKFLLERCGDLEVERTYFLCLTRRMGSPRAIFDPSGHFPILYPWPTAAPLDRIPDVIISSKM